jgi:hypothetical protein
MFNASLAVLRLHLVVCRPDITLVLRTACANGFTRRVVLGALDSIDIDRPCSEVLNCKRPLPDLTGSVRLSPRDRQRSAQKQTLSKAGELGGTFDHRRQRIQRCEGYLTGAGHRAATSCQPG